MYEVLIITARLRIFDFHKNVMDLLGSDTFQSDDEMLKMWGESMKDVNCTSGMCHIEYDDFLLLMKGQKKVINMRRSLEPLSEFSFEEEAPEPEEDQGPKYISPEKYFADATVALPNDIPTDLPTELSSSPPAAVLFHRQGSNSAPATPSHIGRRFDAIDQSYSPVIDENRVTFDEQVFSISPLDLTPPQTPVRGPQDYATPTARRILLNPQLLETLRPPELSLESSRQTIPGNQALHSSFTTTPLVKGRSISLDEKDTFSAKIAAESRASTLFKRDSRRAMAIPVSILILIYL
jgi:hypothetical protein